MEEVPHNHAPNNNLSRDGDWWSETSTEDSIGVLRLDQFGLWSGRFVPPPPRPIFLDKLATPDGLTTCDLCKWAWQEGDIFPLDVVFETPGELGWLLTLIMVSLFSALIGAATMILVLYCKSKRTSTGGQEAQESASEHRTSSSGTLRPPIRTPDDKLISDTVLSNVDPLQQPSTNNEVWSWFSKKPAIVKLQLNAPTIPAENLYTHMNETYNIDGEELYAELEPETSEGNSAYQNSAYSDQDGSRGHSSAYYSDLSVTTVSIVL